VLKICKFIYAFYAEVTPETHAALLFSSCLEWRYVLPLLEESGIETWAIDILGWGFSDLGSVFITLTIVCYLLLTLFVHEIFKMLSLLVFHFLSIRKTSSL